MLAPAVAVETRSVDRHDYVLHPPTGEALADASLLPLGELRDGRASPCDVQIIVTDGLNAYALTDEGHLAPYLEELRRQLVERGFHPAPEVVVVTNGRVRAGYRIGEVLFGGSAASESAAIVNIIGERPGNGHHTFSVYVTRLPIRAWSQPGLADHNHTMVISNVADTALHPVVAAQQTVALLTGHGHSSHS
jgi:ethanolamine ammonia-lyase large subunit